MPTPPELLHHLIAANPDTAGDIVRCLMEYMKMAQREMREDREVARESARHQLSDAGKDLIQDSRAATGASEARDRMQAAMDAATETGGPLSPALRDASSGLGGELASILEDAYQEMSRSEIEDMIQGAIDDLQRMRGGKPGESGKGPKSVVLVGGGILGLLALIGAFLLFGGQQADSVTPEPATDVPRAASPVAAAATVPATICTIQFISPAPTATIPLSGPLTAEWSGVGGAVSYTLEVVQPEGAGKPWLMATDGPSKSIYMENFPAGGDYQLRVTALANDGKALCAATLEFEKDAYDPDTRRQPDEAARSCGPNDPPCQ